MRGRTMFRKSITADMSPSLRLAGRQEAQLVVDVVERIASGTQPNGASDPVFVLTHHPRPPLPMKDGTTFHFVDDGIESALERAFEAAGGQDVLVGGGASTIQQYLRAGLIDEMHYAIVPILLGAGKRLFDHLDGGPQNYECVELVSSPAAAHVRLARTGE